MKIAYLIDSFFSRVDTDKTLAAKDCFFLPSHIVIDQIDYLEQGSFDQTYLDSEIAKAKNVSVIAPTILEIDNLLNEIIASKYDVLVCSLIGSGLSQSQNIVYSAGLSKSITIVNLDCKGLGVMQVHAIKLFKEQMKYNNSLLEVQAKVQHMLDVSHVYGLMDDKNHNSKFNFLLQPANYVSSIIKTKPIYTCLKSSFGKVKVLDKVRKKSKLYDTLVERALSSIDLDEYNIYVAQSNDSSKALLVQAKILELYPDQLVQIVNLPIVASLYTGKSSVLIYVVKK